MKTYEEITSAVLETAHVRTVRIKRVRYAVSTVMVCTACTIGAAAFLKLDKPEIQPSETINETQLHSASDPSTEPPTETTAATTAATETTAPATETTVTETSTTPLIIPTELPVTEAVIVPTEFVPVYVESGTAPIMTSLPGETHHSSAVSKHTTVTSSSETQTETTVTSVSETAETAEITETEETETETEMTEVTEEITETAAEVTDVPETDPTEEPSDSTDPTEPDTTEVTEPDTEQPLPAIDSEEWALLYDMYLRGELPFTFLEELFELPTETQEETISLFPDFTE